MSFCRVGLARVRKNVLTVPDMRVLYRLIFYVVAILVGAALISPPLYWAGQWLIDTGVLPLLKEYRFPKYFNRGALICALAGLYPFLKSLGLSSWRELGIVPNPQKRQDLLIGIGLGVGGLGLAAAFMVGTGNWVLHEMIRWHMIGGALLTAIAVATIEEMLFRGVLYGLIRRHLSWRAALSALSVVFAAIHFLKPHPSLKRFDADVTWSSGFEIIPKLFWQFADFNLIVGGFLTLVLVGWILGYTTEKTKSLWMAIGLHGGWVFALRSFMFSSSKVGETSFWFGRDLITGGAPLVLLGVTLVFLVFGFYLWPREQA